MPPNPGEATAATASLRRPVDCRAGASSPASNDMMVLPVQGYSPDPVASRAHFMTPAEVLQFAKENGARQIDVRFSDIPGLQHHISYPIHELTENAFNDGFGIDGS